MTNALRGPALVHLERSPEEAARILERGSPAEAAALLGQVAPGVSARALALLSPRFAANCFRELSPETQREVLGDLSPTVAAALLRHSPEAAREALLAGLPEDIAEPIRSALTYPRDSAGALASTEALTLSGDLPVECAVELLGAQASRVPDRIVILDRRRRVLGGLRTATLCWAPSGATVGSLALETLSVVRADAPAATAAGDRRREVLPAPVVDRSGAFLGVLDPASLPGAVRREAARPATELLVDFSELCWFGLSGVLAGLTGGTSSPRRGEGA